MEEFGQTDLDPDIPDELLNEILDADDKYFAGQDYSKYVNPTVLPAALGLLLAGGAAFYNSAFYPKGKEHKITIPFFSKSEYLDHAEDYYLDLPTQTREPVTLKKGI